MAEESIISRIYEGHESKEKVQLNVLKGIQV